MKLLPTIIASILTLGGFIVISLLGIYISVLSVTGTIKMLTPDKDEATPTQFFILDTQVNDLAVKYNLLIDDLTYSGILPIAKGAEE